MAAGPGSGETYVFTVDAVRRAISRLAATPAHEHFAGYLALLAAERENKSALHRSAPIWAFHRRYLAVAQLGSNAPWFSPLRPLEGGTPKLIYSNLAGSYGPASLKEGNPFLKAVDVRGKGTNATYALKLGHAQAVAAEMLDGRRVQAIALAAYLYRDYGIMLEQHDLQQVLDIFRNQFGLRASEADEAAIFDAIFDASFDGFNAEDLAIYSQDVV